MAREQAIERLIADWSELVASGEIDAEELRNSLTEQAECNCQGWDSSMEDLEGDPELANIMGYNIDDMTDEQVDEWTQIVTEAARRYLNKEEKK